VAPLEKFNNMNTRQRWPSRWASGSRSGLTLIEVIAGTALAATLLVSILLAMTFHSRQLRQLKLGQAGLELLDQFLAKWAQRDFRDTSLAELAKTTNLHIVANNAPITVNATVPTDLWIRLTSERLPESQPWMLERVVAEAVSQQSGKVIAKLEIVRHVQ
jgi:type II secretory pathway pseudopilin PulG